MAAPSRGSAGQPCGDPGVARVSHRAFFVPRFGARDPHISICLEKRGTQMGSTAPVAMFGD
eukprot:4994937-Pyramimonas_sp.AAC.1